ncbi:hypothetical protein [Chlorogloeopsis sp. ULAP02]|uniref:hypothetical protein n=1 Tax=Chlorogloeopsis sp. ULAP02 TaxID=3107926 RepID=UPI003135C671
MRIIFHVIIKVFPNYSSRRGSKFVNGVATIISALASLLITSYQVDFLPYHLENIHLNDQKNPTCPLVKTIPIEAPTQSPLNY